jgi:hypothetical protein
VEEYNSVDELIEGSESTKTTCQEQMPQMGNKSICSCWFQWNSRDIELRHVDELLRYRIIKCLGTNGLRPSTSCVRSKQIKILALGNLRILRLPGCRQKTDKGRKKLW